MLFGIGWAVADVCPGPIAAQLGQGVPWALATAAGLVLGIWLFSRSPACSCRQRPLQRTGVADVPPDTRMGAVHLTVADLGRSIDYYESAIGLRVHRARRRAGPRWAPAARICWC